MKKVNGLVLVCGLLLVGCGPVPPNPPPTPQCRASGQACADTDDCCNPLICVDQTCIAKTVTDRCGDGKCGASETQTTCCEDCGCPSGKQCVAGNCQSQPLAVCGNGTCEIGETQTSCCKDCGCPSGKTCVSNACQAPLEVCGNNVCAGGESQATCCADCGCPSGYYCNVNSCMQNVTCATTGCPNGYRCNGTSCVYVGTSTMEWVVYDECYRGTMYFRFWDVTNNLVWPADITQAYYGYGGSSYTTSLLCTTGNKICFGGRLANTTEYWGVDMDNSKSCSDCCTYCADKSVTTGSLVCY